MKKRMFRIILTVLLCMSLLNSGMIISFAEEAPDYLSVKQEYGSTAYDINDSIRDNGAIAEGVSISYGETSGGNSYITKVWQSGAVCAENADVTYIDALADGKTAEGSIGSMNTSVLNNSYVSVDLDMAAIGSYPVSEEGGSMTVGIDIRYYKDGRMMEAEAPILEIRTDSGASSIYSACGTELIKMTNPADWLHYTVFLRTGDGSCLVYVDGVLVCEGVLDLPADIGSEDAGAFVEGLKLTVDERAGLTSDCGVKIDNLTTTVYKKGYIGSMDKLFTGNEYYEIDKNYYPGHVRKAMTFTLDDGDLARDKIFFSYTEPAGFKGVVNLISSKITDANKQQYIDMYSDYEIGNHGKYHTFRLLESQRSQIGEGVFNESAADKSKIYVDAYNPELYHIYVAGVSGWREAMFMDDFKAAVEEGGRELEDIFGKDVGYYALPNGYRTEDVGLPEYIASLGYYAVRKTGDLGSGTKFSLPTDYNYITYNATVGNLLNYGAQYYDLPDDGELKYFCFGLHAYDYNGQWNVLEDFCKAYGNRPDVFWYATDREIYDYVNAINKLEINGGEVTNSSDVTVYIKVGGENKTVAPYTTVKFDTAYSLAAAEDTAYAQNAENWNECEHNLVKHDGNAPTCTEAGYADYEVCTDCGHSTYKALEPLGHDHIEHEGMDPTCTEAGYEPYTACSRCDHTTFTEIPAKGHNIEKDWTVTKEPECLVNGERVKHCYDCGELLLTDTVGSLGHDYMTFAAKEPTCTENGNKAFKHCTRCGDTNREDIPAIGHSFKAITQGEERHAWRCEHCRSYGVIEDHTFEGGVCTACGAEGSSGIAGIFAMIAEFINSIIAMIKGIFGMA